MFIIDGNQLLSYLIESLRSIRMLACARSYIWTDFLRYTSKVIGLVSTVWGSSIWWYKYYCVKPKFKTKKKKTCWRFCLLFRQFFVVYIEGKKKFLQWLKFIIIVAQRSSIQPAIYILCTLQSQKYKPSAFFAFVKTWCRWWSVFFFHIRIEKERKAQETSLVINIHSYSQILKWMQARKTNPPNNF